MANVKIYKEFLHIFAQALTVNEILAVDTFDGDSRDARRRQPKPQGSAVSLRVDPMKIGKWWNKKVLKRFWPFWGKTEGNSNAHPKSWQHFKKVTRKAFGKCFEMSVGCEIFNNNIKNYNNVDFCANEHEIMQCIKKNQEICFFSLSSTLIWIVIIITVLDRTIVCPCWQQAQTIKKFITITSNIY